MLKRKREAKRIPRVTVVGMNYAPEQTGSAPYTNSLAVGLARRGSQVSVVCSQPYYPTWLIPEAYKQWRKQLVEQGVLVTRVRPLIRPNVTGLNRLLAEVTFGIRATTQKWSKPDVVVACSPALFATAMVVLRARVERRPVVVWVQDLYSKGVEEATSLPPFAAGAARLLESWVLRSAQRVVVIHERFARHVVDYLGVDERLVAVVRNWSHISQPAGELRPDRAEFGWGDEFVVLHAGNQGLKQGLENVVDAARLADSMKDVRVRFVLLGNGNQNAGLLSRAKGVASIQFMDSLPEEAFLRALGAADALLVNEKPGLLEMSVPSKLTSYFQAARPVIAATEFSSITAEEVALSGAGLCVPSGSPAELLRVCVELSADPELAGELAGAGPLFVREHLTHESALEAWEKILAEVTR